MLAIYDRFGRLQYGNENVIRDILEYVVFEKHIVEEYTNWRIHGKVTLLWVIQTKLERDQEWNWD